MSLGKWVCVLAVWGVLGCGGGVAPGVPDAGGQGGPDVQVRVPGPAQDVVLVAGDGQLEVTWRAPADAGSSALTGYTVTLHPGGHTQTVGAGETRAVFTGLDNGTAYTAQVAAHSGAGTGPAAQATATPHRVPGAVRGLVAQGGNAQVQLHWEAPETDGGAPLEGYQVRVLQQGAEVALHAVAASPFRVMGLENGRAYAFEVRARNAAGLGEATLQEATPAGVPGVPRSLVLLAEDAALTLTWLSPQYEGSSPVLDYRVRVHAADAFVREVTVASLHVTVDALTNGQAYSLEVAARNAEGLGPWAHATGTPHTLPGAPRALVATPDEGQVALSWAAPQVDGGAPVQGYALAVTLEDGTPVGSHETPETAHTVTGLTNGTRYVFQVRARNAAGLGEAAHTSESPLGAPAAPSVLAARPADASVLLSWTPSAQDGGRPLVDFELRVLRDGQEEQRVNTGLVAQRRVEALVNGTPYTFEVRALNAGGRLGAPARVRATPHTLPGTPRDLVAQAGNGQVALTWAAPAHDGGSPVTGYRVLVDTPSSPQATHETHETHLTLPLTNGQAYTFSVFALNAAGPSLQAAQAQATPHTLPGAPVLQSATAGEGEVALTWAAPAHDGGSPVTGYSVRAWREDAEGGQPPLLLQQLEAGARSARVTPLLNGQGYRFAVRAHNAAGEGPDSALSDVVVPRTRPSAPTDVEGTPDSTRVTLRWVPPASSGGSPLTAYTVRVYAAGALVQTRVLDASAGPTWLEAGLHNGTAYTFTVSAHNVAGEGPASSPSLPVTPRTVPEAPASTQAEAGDAQLLARWTAPARDGGSPVTGYRVRTFQAGAAQAVATQEVGAEARTLAVAGLSNGLSHYVEVSALNVAGEGPATRSGWVMPAGVPGPVPQVQVQPGNGNLYVSWNAPPANGSTVLRYRVRLHVGGVEERLVEVAGTSTFLSSLTNGTRYDVTVTAVNGVGEGPASEPVGATPCTTPGAPVGLSAVPGDASATLAWSAPADDGGSPILEYQVVDGSGVQRASAPGTTHSVRVEGLTNGQAIWLQVRARNAAGLGSYGVAVAVTARTVPGAPTLRGAAAMANSVNVVWTPPASNGGAPLTGYTVTVLPAGRTVSFPPDATSGEVTGLLVGETATFTVAAQNAAGTGPASAPSREVTPACEVPGPRLERLTTKSDVVLVDLDGDGRRDIVTGAYRNSTNRSGLEIRRSEGNGHYGAPQFVETPGDAAYLQAGDVTGDGRQDVVTLGQGGGDTATLYVLRNTGDGQLVPMAQTVVPRLHKFILADLDGDNRMDVAGTLISSTATVALLANTDGTFTATSTTHVDASAVTLTAGDFDADGRMDLAVLTYLSSFSSGVHFLKGDGMGSFVKSPSFTTRKLQALAALDLNSDGKLDLAGLMYEFVGQGRYESGLWLLTGNGAGGFTVPPGHYRLDGEPTRVVAGDLDEDGRRDLVVLSTSTGVGANLTAFLGTSSGFVPRPLAMVASPVGLVFDDVDGDGHLDAVTTAYELYGTGNFASRLAFLHGDGKGNLGAASVPETRSARGLALGDLDGDGHPELVTTYGNSQAYIHRGTAGGGFGARSPLNLSSGTSGATLAHLNAGQALDLVFVHQNSRTLSILLGQGDASFSAAAMVDAGGLLGEQRPEAVDVTGDGHRDLVVGLPGSTGAVSVLRNRGDGTFDAAQLYPVSVSPRLLRVADLDGDTLLDIVVAATQGTSLQVLWGEPGGGFVADAAFTLDTGRTNALLVADFTGDGRPDLLTGDRLLANAGARTFAPSVPSVFGYYLAAADINGDGLLDVGNADYSTGVFSLHLGLGGGHFAPGLPFAGGDSDWELAPIHVEGDALPSFLVANQAVGVRVQRTVCR